jgi:hypothetical protein
MTPFFGSGNPKPVPANYSRDTQLEIKHGDKTIATGMWTKSGFLLIAGSLIKEVDIFSKAESGIDKIKKQLIEQGLLIIKGEPGMYELQADIYVSSPNVACGLVQGLASEGSQHWKNSEGTQLGELI